MKIESNTPMPDRVGNGHGGRKYPFNEMEIGQSILISDPTKHQSASKAAMNYARRNGVKFTTRKGEDGMRIWRIE